MQNEADVPLYNTREMKSHGNDIVQQLLKAENRQCWRFLTQWAGYPVSDTTSQPVKAFVHADGKLNKLLIQFCLAGAPNELKEELFPHAKTVFVSRLAVKKRSSLLRAM